MRAKITEQVGGLVIDDAKGWMETTIWRWATYQIERRTRVPLYHAVKDQPWAFVMVRAQLMAMGGP